MQRTEIAGLREEIVCLEGLKGQPKLKPSGMERQAKTRQKAKQARKQAQRRRGAKSFSIDVDRVTETTHPEGWRFKGYEEYLVQDVILRGHLVRYRRERWITPDGCSLMAR